MKVTDEMVAAAMAAFETYFQDPAHERQCDECNGEGCTPVGVDSDRDWCPKCGGPGTLNDATEEGGIRAALESFALSHAAGQDGEQCRAASVLTADMAKALPNGTMDDSTFQAVEDALDAIEAPITGPDGRWLTLPQRIRAFSRGVPEGK